MAGPWRPEACGPTADGLRERGRSSEHFDLGGEQFLESRVGRQVGHRQDDQPAQAQQQRRDKSKEDTYEAVDGQGSEIALARGQAQAQAAAADSDSE